MVPDSEEERNEIDGESRFDVENKQNSGTNRFKDLSDEELQCLTQDLDAEPLNDEHDEAELAVMGLRFPAKSFGEFSICYPYILIHMGSPSWPLSTGSSHAKAASAWRISLLCIRRRRGR